MPGENRSDELGFPDLRQIHLPIPVYTDQPDHKIDLDNSGKNEFPGKMTVEENQIRIDCKFRTNGFSSFNDRYKFNFLLQHKVLSNYSSLDRARIFGSNPPKGSTAILPG